jgi:hypothetical protein
MRTISCHDSKPKPPAGPAPRRGLTRGASVSALIVEPQTPEIATTPAEPTIKISPKIRQAVKSLEFSFMLGGDHVIKLLNEIHDLVKGNAAKQREFGTGKGNASFVKILKKNEDNPAVLEAAFLLLADLAETEVNRDALALQGCIEMVLVGMLKSEEDLVLHERGCYALASLAGTQKYQEWIVSSSGIQVIMTTQSAFKQHEKIQTACSRALRALAHNNKENGFSIAAKGGVRALMEIVHDPLYAQSVMLHREACATMATLARTNDSNRGAIAAGGGIGTTLSAVKRFPDDGDLQATEFDTLYSLSLGHTQNSNSIAHNDGIRLLIQTMKLHAIHTRVQEAAIAFATVMTDSSQMAKNIGNEGGIQVVLSAMRQHESSQTVQEEGCSTLCNLAMVQENKAPICSLGGIGMIVTAMRQLCENSFVQKNGCKALESLSTNDQNKKSIAAAGGCTAMLAAMKKHPTAAGVQGLAVSALRKLATISRNQSLMKTNDGIEIVEWAMKDSPKHVHLQQNGIALLQLLDPSRVEDDASKGIEDM